ncbi:hypothetical protein Q1695_009296 [Nippostrongylus brasiliensis]|nr:hypothetical protein Q1695_009296 [Nippostrongylus brasiliensis]
MEVDSSVDDAASQASNTSASSMALQFSAEDLQENNVELVPTPASEVVRNEGKRARLNRRLALANLQLPKLSVKPGAAIDLRTEEDKLGDISWLKKKFPSIDITAKKTESPVPPSSANAPPSVAKQRTLKQMLEKKLAERRRAGLAKRKELYMEDNEGILESDDDNEDAEEGTDGHKKKKNGTSNKNKKAEIISSGDDSDNDYGGDDEQESEGSGSESSPSDGEENDEDKDGDLPESVDLFDGASVTSSTVKESQKHEEDSLASHRNHEQKVPGTSDTTANEVQNGRDGHLLHTDSLNLMLDGDCDSSSTTGMTQPQFPNSLSQWFGDRGTADTSEDVEPPSQSLEFVNIGSFSDADPFKGSSDDDLLMLCSGRFDSQNLVQPSVSSADADTADDDMNLTTTSQKKRVLIESDDEDETTEKASVLEDTLEKSSALDVSGAETADDDQDVDRPSTHRRAFFESDSEDSVHSHTDGKDGADGDDVSENDEKEQEDSDADSEPQPQFGGRDFVEEEAEEDDSDDELAVVRRLEKGEFERKANRENWFDDEASLSGDDVGSDLDLDDTEAPNEYEAEEGDDDDIPDADVIRRQNHRLLLKQEKDREHLELVKLQDRLLADGDLGGAETNRTFRLKLREDIETIEECAEEDSEQPEEEELEAEISQANARRVEAIKFLLDHKDHANGVDDKEEDDIFDIAARSAQITTEVSATTASKASRTLLGQPNLANAIKEVAGVSTVKQLYVSSTSTDRKRSSSPVQRASKRSRTTISVLSMLEDE